MPEAAVVAKDLVKERYGRRIVDGVTLEVSRGETLALLGPPGAGKTTILEMLAGSARPTAGSVTVLGVDPADRAASKPLRRRMGFMPRGVAAFSRLTVKENVEFFAAIYGADASRLLESVGAAQHAATRFSRLGDADRRKVGLAMSLAGDPEVFLLDEPTSGLDAYDAREVRRTIKGLAKGRAVLLSTSSAEEAEELGGRVGIMANGRVLAMDSPANLLAAFGGGQTIVFRGGGDSAFGTLRRLFETVSMEGTDVVLPFENLRDLEVALRELVGRGISSEVFTRSPTLGSILRRLTEPEPPGHGAA